MGSISSVPFENGSILTTVTYLDTKVAEPRQRVPVQYQLSPQDWILLEIQSLLKPLYEITMKVSGLGQGRSSRRSVGSDGRDGILAQLL